jgi:hypothetical protein
VGVCAVIGVGTNAGVAAGLDVGVKVGLNVVGTDDEAGEAGVVSDDNITLFVLLTLSLNPPKSVLPLKYQFEIRRGSPFISSPLNVVTVTVGASSSHTNSIPLILLKGMVNSLSPLLTSKLSS